MYSTLHFFRTLLIQAEVENLEQANQKVPEDLKAKESHRFRLKDMQVMSSVWAAYEQSMNLEDTHGYTDTHTNGYVLNVRKGASKT